MYQMQRGQYMNPKNKHSLEKYKHLSHIFAELNTSVVIHVSRSAMFLFSRSSFPVTLPVRLTQFFQYPRIGTVW